MKLTDDIIEAYLKGALSGPQAAEFEREMSALMRQAAPEVPSQRMLKGIRTRLAAGEGLEKARPGLGERLLALFGTPSPVLRWGAAGAMACLLLALGLHLKQGPNLNGAPEMAAQQPAPPAPQPGLRVAVAHPRPVSVRPARRQASLSAPGELALAPAQAQPKGPTEVEQALADQDVNGAMNAIVMERERVGSRPYLVAPSLAARSVGLDSGGARAQQVGDSSISMLPPAAPVLSKVSVPDSRAGQDGSWDFGPAASAMNSRDWSSAAAELESAALHAPAQADRSFASSSLQLLSQQGQPLANAENIPDDPGQGLSVQAAERWQYFAENRAAVYSGGVLARMAGLRSEGAGLELDLGLDRASFSPGTHFVRLADDAATKVLNSDGSLLGDNEFNAPRGATYSFSKGQLILK